MIENRFALIQVIQKKNCRSTQYT